MAIICFIFFVCKCKPQRLVEIRGENPAFFFCLAFSVASWVFHTGFSRARIKNHFKKFKKVPEILSHSPSHLGDFVPGCLLLGPRRAVGALGGSHIRKQANVRQAQERKKGGRILPCDYPPRKAGWFWWGSHTYLLRVVCSLQRCPPTPSCVYPPFSLPLSRKLWKRGGHPPSNCSTCWARNVRPGPPRSCIRPVERISVVASCVTLTAAVGRADNIAVFDGRRWTTAIDVSEEYEPFLCRQRRVGDPPTEKIEIVHARLSKDRE